MRHRHLGHPHWMMAVAALACAAGAPAWSQVPDAVASASLTTGATPSANTTTATAPGHYDSSISSSSDGKSASASAAVFIDSTGPSIFGQAFHIANGLSPSSLITADYTYYFEATGPQSTVNLDWNAFAGVAGSTYDSVGPTGIATFKIGRLSDNYSTTNFTLQWDGGRYTALSDGIKIQSGDSPSASVTANGSLQVQTDQVYAVTLSLLENDILIGGTNVSGGVSVYIDPLITISSDNPDPSAFGLDFSDGVVQSLSTPDIEPPTGPVTAVPEPFTWTLMLTGLASVGLALRRRKGSLRLSGSPI